MSALGNRAARHPARLLCLASQPMHYLPRARGATHPAQHLPATHYEEVGTGAFLPRCYITLPFNSTQQWFGN